MYDRQPSTSSSSSNGSGGTRNTTTYYAGYIRLYKNKAPSLKCTSSSDLFTIVGTTNGNNALTYPVGLITADEVAYAGGVYATANSSYYLYTNEGYWTMSPFTGGDYANVFNVYSTGKLSKNLAGYDYGYGVRPVINLKSSTLFTGNGTSTDPYVVA